MVSADRTSIHTDRLAYTWKVEMKRKCSIKEGVTERGSEKEGKIIIASRTDFVIKLERNT